jgi:hypothetical protein
MVPLYLKSVEHLKQRFRHQSSIGLVAQRQSFLNDVLFWDWLRRLFTGQYVADGVVCGGAIARVEESADAVVVLSEVVAQVDGGDTAHGRVEALLHDRRANLVNNNVYPQFLAEYSHFKLAAPHPVLTHIIDVVFNGDIVFNVKPVDVLVFLNQLTSLLP